MRCQSLRTGNYTLKKTSIAQLISSVYQFLKSFLSLQVKIIEGFKTYTISLFYVQNILVYQVITMFINGHVSIRQLSYGLG